MLENAITAVLDRVESASEPHTRYVGLAFAFGVPLLLGYGYQETEIAALGLGMLVSMFFGLSVMKRATTTVCECGERVDYTPYCPMCGVELDESEF